MSMAEEVVLATSSSNNNNNNKGLPNTVPKRTRKRTPNVKTGCITCKIRRIKCDEQRPACQKCVSTGRKCDGYPDVFRAFVESQDDSEWNPAVLSSSSSARESSESARESPEPSRIMTPTPVDTTPQEMRILQMVLERACEILPTETVVANVLEFSNSEPAVRHALVSMGAVLEMFAKDPDQRADAIFKSPEYPFALLQYNKALAYVVKQIDNADDRSLKIISICCRVFILFELGLNNYTAAIAHFIRVLRILFDAHSRPYLDEANFLIRNVPRLWALDNFMVYILCCPLPILKVPPWPAGSTSDKTTHESTEGISLLDGADPALLKKIQTAHKELFVIGISTMEFNKVVSALTTSSNAIALLPKREQLLSTTRAWLSTHSDLFLTPSYSPLHPAVCFLGLFRAILTVTLSLTLKYSPDSFTALAPEFSLMVRLAHELTDLSRCMDNKFARIAYDMGFVTKNATSRDSAARIEATGCFVWRMSVQELLGDVKSRDQGVKCGEKWEYQAG